MAAMSDFLEDELLDHVLRNTAYTSPTTIFVALFTTATDDAAGGTEVTGGSYARTSVAFNAPSAGTVDNSATVTFPTATASWGTVTHMALYDASSGGNRLYHGALTTSKTVDNGDVFTFPASNLTVSHD